MPTKTYKCIRTLPIAALCWIVILGLPIAARAQSPASPSSPSAAPVWDTQSDTWDAQDGLGRVLPNQTQAGPPRGDKFVGIFYFLTFDHTTDGPYDNTKILEAHPEALNDVHNPAWGPLNTAHYWGEPLFGYYVSDDEWVLRKHAQMLSDAGVDVVIFDNSNTVTYDRARNRLCEVWEQIRREGGRTPQIAFHCPFGNPRGIGTSTMRELYDTIYAPGRYADLWFRWEGKPLIIADPSYADPASIRAPERTPTALAKDASLGQSFTAERPFIAVGGAFPTWGTKGSAVTIALYAGDRPGGSLLAHAALVNLVDNAQRLLTLDKPLPAGKYYLELSHPIGHVGWWGSPTGGYAGGKAYENDTLADAARTLAIHYADATKNIALSPDAMTFTDADKTALAQKLRDFFTFRSPIAPYNIPNPPLNHWAWLQISPQAPQRDMGGKVEEVSVGVAQNYNATVNRTAPMSFPGAFGRSYHGGASDPRPDASRYGFNFAEQWERARQLDPPFVFVTGWNEWTAGFYDQWAGFHAPPAVFVDEFNEENSRDVEPMRDRSPDGHGGHGDDYYYQLVAEIRRYKGVHTLGSVTPATIPLTTNFGAWKKIQPEYRDDIGDTAHRSAPGSGNVGPYVNTTGRNDIIAAKVSFDRQNVYFYVRTEGTLTTATGDNWMLLFLNTGKSTAKNWMGYDFIVNRVAPKSGKAFVQRCVGTNQFAWGSPIAVPCHISNNEMALAIPRTLLGLTSLPAALRFKWADNCLSTQPNPTDFTVNGDAAPNGRFSYRALLSGPVPAKPAR